jgi:hypothetical protein
MKFTKSTSSKVPYSQEYFSVLQKEQRPYVYYLDNQETADPEQTAAIQFRCQLPSQLKAYSLLVTSLSANKNLILWPFKQLSNKKLYSATYHRNYPRDEIYYRPQNCNVREH